MGAAEQAPLAVVADAETGGPQGVEVTLHTTNAKGVTQEIPLTVPPAGKWRISAVQAANTAQFVAWAQAVLSPADAAKVVAADPTLEEMGEFFVQWRTRSGENPGK